MSSAPLQPPPAPVGSARDLFRGISAGSAAFLILLCTGAFNGATWIGALQLGAALLGTLAVWIATQPGPGPDRPVLRWLARLAWVPFLLSLMFELPRAWLEIFDLVLQAPFLLSIGALVASHVRPGSRPSRRLRIDGSVLAALFLCLWALDVVNTLTDVATATWAGATFFFSGLGSVIGAMVLFNRLPDTARALNPGILHPAWPRAAAAGRWRIHEGVPGASWQALVPLGPPDAPTHQATIEIQRDPVPPQTRIVLALPELAGLSVTRRPPDDPGDEGEGEDEDEGGCTGALIGDPTLDGAVEICGDLGLARRVLSQARASWLQLIRSDEGALSDGVLILLLPGGIPRASWLEGYSAAEPSDVVEALIEHLEAVAASATQPPAGGEEPGQRPTS